MKKLDKKARQKYQAGSIVEIQLNNGKLAFGRLLPGEASSIAVFDFIIDSIDSFDLNQICKQPILFYCGLFREIITKGIFRIIGVQEFSEKEISEMPYIFFKQDRVNIFDCFIFGPVKDGRLANPQECINLERSSVWDENGIVQRIEDYYAGKKNFHVELDKVILSENDPRYLAPPLALRWDAAKQEFNRIDI